MEEIDLKEIAYFIFKRKKLVVSFMLIGAILGFIYTKYFITPMYSASTTVVLSKVSSSTDNQINNIDDTTDSNLEQNLNNSITQNDVTLNSKLVATYSEIMKSRVVAQDVKARLNLDIEEESIMKNTSVSTKDDTEMLKIQVLNEDKDVAANIANALADVFKDKVRDIYNIENVTVVDKAIPDDTPTNVNFVKSIILFAIVGVFLSCFILFVFFYFDNTIRSKTQVEKLLGLETLAVIPEIKNRR